MPITPRNPRLPAIWLNARLTASSDLRALVGDRLYPDYAVPANVTSPYVYWSQSSNGVKQHAGPHQIQLVERRFTIRAVSEFASATRASYTSLVPIQALLQTIILDPAAPSEVAGAGNVWEARFIDFYEQAYDQGDRRVLELGFMFSLYAT